MQAADVVTRFVESIGRHREAEFWLKLFRAEAKERFATLVIDAAVLDNAIDALVLDLRFLASVELTPVVCVGIDAAERAYNHAALLAQALQQASVPTALIPLGQSSGFTAMTQATHKGIVPIVYPQANEPRLEHRLAELLNALHVRKLIFVDAPGALSVDGAPISNINLTTEFDTLIQSASLTRPDRLQLARQLVFEWVKHPLLVSVTSPFDLLRELFTVKGAGTMLRRGATILMRHSYREVDTTRLTNLLTHSFGRPPRADFFKRDVSRIYLEENYRGAALLHDTDLGGYLSKFAVERQAQGEGLGGDLWGSLVSDYKSIFWRSRSKNPINTWYAKEADGTVRTPEWHLFWRGIAVDDIPQMIRYALAQPDDMGAPAPSAGSTC